MSKVTITEDVEYCSMCPFGSVSEIYWNPDFEQENQDVYCSKLKCFVYDKMHWTEIAARNSLHKGIDVPPDNCPFKQQ